MMYGYSGIAALEIRRTLAFLQGDLSLNIRRNELRGMFSFKTKRLIQGDPRGLQRHDHR
jgi:hypothetical protein